MPPTLIVARMQAAAAPDVAGIFARSDTRTELPGLMGVRRRVLFRFHDLYFHLIDSADGLGERLTDHRAHPDFTDVNRRLAEFIRPYSPQWRSPADAMATPFYEWTADV
ncbi:TcmI family type II polyketide cyclase [Dactylosporangium sp. AC04546]|uniref:TcmI family type II polyketide cyclase n=1 Tax=Dactylosporangium sp. AC04546 TaxID=2862460 RepID=UPI001EE1052E|nr:TcmI family type II polyketide cyclase [Dactylosporangium sp. AC04546]WVK79071.1 TcmI family type II polyketide cyclase [Dactylosporangium sp. AC04546]